MPRERLFTWCRSDYMNAGKLCRWYRVRHKLTQKDMADLIAVSQSHISALEQGLYENRNGRLLYPSRIVWEINQLIDPDGPDGDLYKILTSDNPGEDELKIVYGIK
jgi:transcriptional regulator with XRE-family HTH domain